MEYWCDTLPVGGIIEFNDVHLKVSDVWDSSEGWRLENLHTTLPTLLLHQILEFPMPLANRGDDRRIFIGSSDGKFSCKLAYSELGKRRPASFCLNELVQAELSVEATNTTRAPTENWTWIWNFKCPAKLQFFLWFCQHDRLPTNAILAQRKVIISDICQLCNTAIESVFHVIWDCPAATEVWELSVAPSQWFEFKAYTCEDRFHKHISKKHFGNSIVPDAPWNLVFIATAWQIWKARNDFIFRGQVSPLRVTSFRIRQLVLDMVKAFENPMKSKERVSTEEIKWIRPRRGWTKLNTDARVITVNGSAAIGGLNRDDEGHFVFGFSKKIGSVSINLAELLALREGMRLAWERGFTKIIVELDSKVIYELFNANDTEDHPFHSLLTDCREFAHLWSDFDIQHTRRGGNKCADHLAKLGHGYEELTIWDTPPESLEYWLEADNGKNTHE